MTIRKRSLIRILCFSWALTALFGGVALMQSKTVSAYRLLLGEASARALSGIGRSLEQVGNGLQKSLVYSSPDMLGQSAMELAVAASGGRASLDCLPLAAGELDEVGVYLSQLADYAASLGKEAVSEQGMSQQSKDNLTALLDYNEALSQSLFEAEQAISSGEAEVEALCTMVSCDRDCPTLLYDGIYSAHMLQPTESVALLEAPEVTREQAGQAASEFLGVEPDRLVPAGETGGDLPTYRFVMDDVTVEVSVAGGEIVSMVNGRALRAGELPVEEALDGAQGFLEGLGYTSMEPVSYDVSDMLVTAVFAYVGEDVLFYPDSVTVSVAREGGDVVSFSAREYLMNHSSSRTAGQAATGVTSASRWSLRRRRSRWPAGTARLKTEDAQDLAPQGHTMESARYAVISSPGGLENQALELTTSMGGRRYLYYLDAMSADELKLSCLYEDEQGRRMD